MLPSSVLPARKLEPSAERLAAAGEACWAKLGGAEASAAAKAALWAARDRRRERAAQLWHAPRQASLSPHRHLLASPRTLAPLHPLPLILSLSSSPSHPHPLILSLSSSSSHPLFHPLPLIHILSSSPSHPHLAAREPRPHQPLPRPRSELAPEPHVARRVCAHARAARRLAACRGGPRPRGRCWRRVLPPRRLRLDAVGAPAAELPYWSGAAPAQRGGPRVGRRIAISNSHTYGRLTGHS